MNILIKVPPNDNRKVHMVILKNYAKQKHLDSNQSITHP